MSDPSYPLDQLLACLREQLQYVAPIDKYKRELFKNGKSPRYVWVPMGGPWGGGRFPGRNPRNAALWTCRVDLYAFAVDDEQAWRLVQSAATALEKAFGGRSYQLKNVAPSSPPWLSNGVLWVLTLEALVDVPEAALPEGPTEPVTDNDITTVRPETVEQMTPALSTSGDDTLEGTET